MIPDCIFLLGFMGAGKSSLGKKLATKLNFTFIDADSVIEKQLNCSISQIFEEKGEEFFREIEHNWLKGTDFTKSVIALGGGTPCFYNNMQIINKKGSSVFIDVSVEILIGRLKQNKNKRPLLASLNDIALSEFVRKTYSDRINFYQKAHFRLQKTNSKAEDIVSLF